ncbi:hypothetical protein ACFFWD_09625 [Bradyrhizobium erythrophlei]|uniref:hypothetical protein n=1 Tax=Bradyrhizobium erythrophlei TaxID=1437360 RepID=UPI0035EFBC01
MTDPPSYPGAPHWLRMFAFAVGAFVLLVIALGHFGGAPRYGPPAFGSHHHSTAPEGNH